MAGPMASLLEAATLAEAFATAENALKIEALASHLAASIRGGGKVLICGNGGSLCDAAHFAEELTGRFRADRPALPAIAITDPGHLTCTANDYGFEHVFFRAGWYGRPTRHCARVLACCVACPGAGAYSGARRCHAPTIQRVIASSPWGLPLSTDG